MKPLSRDEHDILQPVTFIARYLKYFAQEEEIERRAAGRSLWKSNQKALRHRGWRQFLEDCREFPFSQKFETHYNLLHPTDYILREVICGLDEAYTARVIRIPLEREFFGRTHTFPNAPLTITQKFLDESLAPVSQQLDAKVNGIVGELQTIHRWLRTRPEHLRPVIHWQKQVDPRQFFEYTAPIWFLFGFNRNDAGGCVSPFSTDHAARLLHHIQSRMLDLGYCWEVKDRRNINAVWGKNHTLDFSVVDTLQRDMPQSHDDGRSDADFGIPRPKLAATAAVGTDHTRTFLMPSRRPDLRLRRVKNYRANEIWIPESLNPVRREEEGKKREALRQARWLARDKFLLRELIMDGTGEEPKTEFPEEFFRNASHSRAHSATAAETSGCLAGRSQAGACDACCAEQSLLIESRPFHPDIGTHYDNPGSRAVALSGRLILGND